MSGKIRPIVKHGAVIQIDPATGGFRIFISGKASFDLLTAIDDLRDEVFARLNASLPPSKPSTSTQGLDFGTRAQP